MLTRQGTEPLIGFIVTAATGQPTPLRGLVFRRVDDIAFTIAEPSLAIAPLLLPQDLRDHCVEIVQCANLRLVKWHVVTQHVDRCPQFALLDFQQRMVDTYPSGLRSLRANRYAASAVCHSTTQCKARLRLRRLGERSGTNLYVLKVS